MFFIYYFLYDPTYDLSKKAHAFFKDIEDGNFIGMISSFSIMEYIGVAKKLFSEKLGRSISYDETQAVKRVIIDFIKRMGIMLYNSNSLAVPLHSTSCSLFSECEDLIEQALPTLGAIDNKWHSLTGADSLHAIFAIRLGAEYLATNDDDFRGIHNNIKILMVREQY